mmetsp:Transcript_1435/g.1980  ORF Transcript_1435/g.1980 Transcript_1435/m.1980 type:complete len:917 (-) Transcript_1435:66-2816(-)
MLEDKWAKGFCSVSTRKTSLINSFEFFLCLPSDMHVPSGGGGIDTDKDPTYTLSGLLSEVQTGVGVEASVKIFRGNVPGDGQPLAETMATLTAGTRDTSDDDQGPYYTSCMWSALLNQSSSEETVFIEKSEYTFTGLSAGTYTLVVEYEAGLLTEGVSSPTVFNREVVYVAIEDDDVNYDISVSRNLNEGEMVILFETETPSLDLVAHFTGSGDGNCTLSAKLLADDACGCSSGYVIRSDKSVQSNGKSSQVLYFADIRQTIYEFYITRNRPVPSTSYVKHRVDGRAGPNFPLESGEPAQCPPVSVTWQDGLTEMRACADIEQGLCSNSSSFCIRRYSIDYRRFLDDAWKTEYREDGICNHPDLMYTRDDGETKVMATCPEASPCCSPAGKCGSTDYHCNMPTSIDYRPFYLADNETSTNASIDSTVHSIEESNSKITVFTSEGRVKEFLLPASDEELNYFDLSPYEVGNPSSGGIYFRSFCVKATDGSSLVEEYPAPRYFNWKGQMLGMAQGCPATTDCSFIRIKGLPAANTAHPDLNGVFLRRYETEASYKAFPGYEVSQSCRYSSSYMIRKIDDVDNGRECMQHCTDDNECHVAEYEEALDESTQQAKTTCYIFREIHICGGKYLPYGSAIDMTYVKSVSYTYEKLSKPSRGNGIWFSQTTSMFYPEESQVHLYRDEATLTWYLDNDRISSNGHFAFATTNAQTDIPPAMGWATKLPGGSFLSFSSRVDILPYFEDCLQGRKFPTVESVFESRGCNCGGTANLPENCAATVCEGTILKLAGTNICLEGFLFLGLGTNACESHAKSQRFYFNKQLGQLEVKVEDQHTVVHVDPTGIVGVYPVQDQHTQVPDAIRFQFTPEGYICKYQEIKAQTSYTEEVEDTRECLSVWNGTPGERPMFLEASEKENWSVFTVV